MTIRKFTKSDVTQMISIWNDIVEEGVAFPQENYLDIDDGYEFFSSQSHTAVCELDGRIVGLYILHPNNIGRCGHICNASYAVDKNYRGIHIGEKLVLDCMQKAKELKFKILQFNAVVETNTLARHLYERLGFIQLGTIKNGFRLPNGTYKNICPYYIEL